MMSGHTEFDAWFSRYRKGDCRLGMWLHVSACFAI